jgi:hypothetical protein
MYTFKFKKVSFLFLILGLLAIFSEVGAQTYTKLNVKGRVQIEVPADWTINDSEQRKRVTELSEKITGMRDLNVATLSVHSFPTPSKMFIRVSFIKQDPPISQAEFVKEFNADRKLFLREVEDGWKTEAPKMWSALGKNGVREVGKPSFSVEPIGGQSGIVIRYARTSVGNPNETMNVAQYHVLIGSEKALITLSTIDNDVSIKAAHDRIKNSISIK